jgi:hypothetical protein
MRTSASSAAVFVLVLLTTMEAAEAIRLDAESRAAVSQSHQQQTATNVSDPDDSSFQCLNL